MSNAMEEVDVRRELGIDSANALREAAKADSPPRPGQAPVKREFVKREITFPVEIRDAYTNEVVERIAVTSRVLDGGEEAQAVRYAAQLAGVPMDTLSKVDRDWFRAIARCEKQIRAVSGTGFASDLRPEQRLIEFFNRLWADGEILASVHGRLEEHGARFRIGEPRQGEGPAQFARVVVPAIWPADDVPPAG